MKRNNRNGLAVLVIFCVIAGLLYFICGKRSDHKKVADEQQLLGLLYQQRAGEYRALCLQAYNLAKMQVDSCLRIKGKHKPYAIVTDLDETALDNSPGEAWAYKKDTTFDLKQWWLQGKPGAVPGSVPFFNYAALKGFKIYYVSNRQDSLSFVDSTRARMHKLGFPLTDYDSNFLFFTTTNSKESRRQEIQAQGDTIILLLGDNLGDINKAFDKVNGKYLAGDLRRDAVDQFGNLWGTKYIVFPNAVYGDWEGLFYQGRSLDLKQKHTIREQLLTIKNK
jgi:5'-nucleotidase (lipoprotein e(P4) family)